MNEATTPSATANAVEADDKILGLTPKTWARVGEVTLAIMVYAMLGFAVLFIYFVLFYKPRC